MVFGLTWVHMTTTLHPGPTHFSRGLRINHGLSAVTTMASEASREDSPPYAFLKLHRLCSLDYRAQQELPVKFWCFIIIEIALISQPSLPIKMKGFALFTLIACCVMFTITSHLSCTVHSALRGMAITLTTPAYC